jgi:hypothetical protein
LSLPIVGATESGNGVSLRLNASNVGAALDFGESMGEHVASIGVGFTLEGDGDAGAAQAFIESADA